MKSCGQHTAETVIESLPARGAWVEIGMVMVAISTKTVAPRTGSVG